MKLSRKATPAVTSLPRAPRDEERSRVRTYAITMSIRMLCFLLMALVTPYGWHTWVFALGAAVLPYIAVVMANAVQSRGAAPVESPERALEAPQAAVEPDTAPPRVIRLEEASAPTDEERGPDEQ